MFENQPTSNLPLQVPATALPPRRWLDLVLPQWLPERLPSPAQGLVSLERPLPGSASVEHLALASLVHRVLA